MEKGRRGDRAVARSDRPGRSLGDALHGDMAASAARRGDAPRAEGAWTRRCRTLTWTLAPLASWPKPGGTRRLAPGTPGASWPGAAR